MHFCLKTTEQLHCEMLSYVSINLSLCFRLESVQKAIHIQLSENVKVLSLQDIDITPLSLLMLMLLLLLLLQVRWSRLPNLLLNQND